MICQKRMTELEEEKDKYSFDISKKKLEKKIAEMIGKEKEGLRQWRLPKWWWLYSSRLLKNIERL